VEHVGDGGKRGKQDKGKRALAIEAARQADQPQSDLEQCAHHGKSTPRKRGSARNKPFQLACMAHNESGR
jgi:hypothetical protein